MSAQSAFGAETAVENALTVAGIELVCAAEALEYVEDGLEPGVGTGAAYDAVREVVPPLDGDRPLHDDIERARALVAGGLLEERVDGALDGELE